MSEEKLDKILNIIFSVLLLLYGTLTLIFSSTLSIIPKLFSILLICFCIFTFVKKKYFSLSPYIILTLLFVICTYLSTFINLRLPTQTTITLLSFLSIFIYMFINCQKLNYKFICIPLIIAIFLFGIYFVITNFNNIISLKFLNERLYFDVNNQNEVANFFSVGVTISLVLILKEKRFFYLIFAVVFFMLGVVAGSRIFFIAVIAEVAILPFFLIKSKLISFVILLSLFALSIVLINLPFFQNIKYRFDMMIGTILGLPNTQYDYSIKNRIDMIKEAILLFGEKPIFGHGLTGFQMNSYINEGYCHNTICELLCNFGIVGTVLWVVSLLKTQKNFNSKSFWIIFVYLLIRSITGVLFVSKSFYLILIVLFAINYESPSSEYYCLTI